MNTNFIDEIRKPEQLSSDETIRNLEIKLLQIETRINSLENLVNAMHEYIRVWYDK